MRDQKEHFRNILLFHYRKDKNTVQEIGKKLREVYKESVLTVRQCQKVLFKISFRQFRR